MAVLEGYAFVTDGDQFVLETEATPRHALGQEKRAADGRIFRYAKAGAVAISKGKLQLAPARKTNHDNIACAAASVGATSVTVTLGATAATANEYAEGYFCINDVDGEGQTYKIGSHPAANSSATLVLTLLDPIKTALTANSEACLVHNSYNGVVEGTSSTQRPAGVPLVDFAIGDFGWLQTRGVCAVLADETLALGADLTPGTSTAGAVEEADDDTTPLTDSYVGKAIVAGVDTEYRPVYLEID